MDEGWVEMKVQNWHLHCRILCQMVVDQAFEGSARLSGRKVQTWEAFNFCKKSSISRPCQDERSHLGKCDGYAKGEMIRKLLVVLVLKQNVSGITW